MTNRGDVSRERMPVVPGFADLVTKAFGRDKSMINPSLLLHRLVEWQVDTGGHWDFRQEDQKGALERVARAITSSAVQEGLDAFRQRQLEMVKSLQRCGYAVGDFCGRVQWRLAIGMATGGVLEAGGMTLHRLYGFPYLPGTALKGLASAWARELSDREELKPERLAEVFGTSRAQGHVVFFDAVPQDVPDVAVDIMNPHYKSYYDRKGPPADYLSPEMVYFLTIKEGTQFRFWMAVRPGMETSLEPAKRFLKEGLANLGIGAKTHAGYGRVE